MLRFLLTACCACLLIACSRQEQHNKSPALAQIPAVGKAASAPVTFVVTPNYFDRVKKQEEGEVAKSRGVVTRKGLTLKLQLANGKFSQLIDKQNCESDAECVHYVYRGTVADGQFYWVDVVYDEGSTVLLIARKTGEQIDVYAEPHLSPDGKYMVTVSGQNEVAFGGTPDVFLWEITDGVMKLSSRLFPDDVYYFQFEGWAGSEKINLKAIKDPPEGMCKKYGLAEYQIILIQQYGRWALQLGSEPAKCQ